MTNALELETLAEIARKSTCKILVREGGKQISFGSGAVISLGGLVLTALHVVSNGKQIRGSEVRVQFDGNPNFYPYTCLTEPDLSIDTGAWESNPFRVDQAVLQPVGILPFAPSPLKIRDDIASVGTEAMLAGFSDDVCWPLDLDESFDKRKLEGGDKEKEFKEMEPALRQVLVKRAMVGSIFRLRVTNWGTKDGINAAAYTLDNDISYGASGGPVIDRAGRLFAIICKRGLGSATKYQIPIADGEYLPKWPTGTSYALSCHFSISRLGSTTERPVAALAKPLPEDVAGRSPQNNC